MQRKPEICELFRIRQDTRFKVMKDLVSDDPSLNENAAIQRMFEKIRKRRSYVECVMCDKISPEVWNHIYEKDRFVGWHCDDHRDEFHAIQVSGRHCCEVRTSSGQCDILDERYLYSSHDQATQM